MTTAATTVPSPIGPLTLLSDGQHLTGVRMDGQRHAPPLPPDTVRYDAAADDLPVPLAAAAAQLAAYFAGERTAFDLPLAPQGTPFQRRVWQALREVPYGTTTSYGELARRIGRPGAVRAVGLANGRNPLPIVVPCHRVIGADGSLTGYGGGLDRKRYLLGLEADELRLRLEV